MTTIYSSSAWHHIKESSAECVHQFHKYIQALLDSVKIGEKLIQFTNDDINKHNKVLGEDIINLARCRYEHEAILAEEDD